MKDQFVLYERSLRLKELGFDEECIAWYLTDLPAEAIHSPIISSYSSDWNVYKDRVNAPVYQQAFDWFREEYGLHGWTQPMGEVKPGFYSWYIHSTNGIVLNEIAEPKYKEWEMSFPTNTSARLACLDKLIEIVKSQK